MGRMVVEDSSEQPRYPSYSHFHTTWCAPCRAQAPVLDRLASDFDERVDIVKVDIDANPDLAARYGVRSIPTLLLFDGGRVAATRTGLTPRAELAALLKTA